MCKCAENRAANLRTCVLVGSDVAHVSGLIVCAFEDFAILSLDGLTICTELRHVGLVDTVERFLTDFVGNVIHPMPRWQ